MKSVQTIDDFRNALVGLPVSHVWFGYGSALFIEFGPLDCFGSSKNRSGVMTLMIEWSWRIEKPKSILCGSWSKESSWKKIPAYLLDAQVVSFEIFGQLPEVCLTLSNHMRVVSFMTEQGQPQWALIRHVSPKGSLSVKRGRLCVEPS